MNITYKPKTHKENGLYYPVIAFYTAKISDCYYINKPTPTRSRARTIAKNHIKTLKNK